MIAFFPELYEDELAYSWFSRYYIKSGYLSLRYALDDLYVKRYVNPDTEFVNELRPEVKELVIKHCGMENLILGHTMFSSYGRFLPDAKKQEAYRRNWKCGCVKRRRKPPLQGMHAGFLRGGCRLRAGYPWQSF